MARRVIHRTRTPALALLAATIGAASIPFKPLFGLAVLLPVALTALAFLVRRLHHGVDRALEHQLLLWTLGAFAVHFLFGVVVTSNPAALGFFGGDAGTYHDIARGIVSHWNGASPLPALPVGKEGFFYLLAGIYWLVGPYTHAGLVVNSFFAAALIPIAGDTTRRLFGPAPLRYIGPLLLLLPGLFVWTSQLLKEPMALFLIVVSANCAVRIGERFSMRAVLLIGVAIALLFTVRSYVALTVAAGLIAALAVTSRGLVSGVGTGVGAASVFSLLLASGLGVAGYNAAVNADLKGAQVIRTQLSTTAASGYQSEGDISTFRSAGVYLPRGLLTFLGGPFPWRLSGSRQLLALADVLVWWALLPSLWRGLTTGYRRSRRRSVLLVLPAATTAALFSLVVGNYGVLVRERTQIVVLLVPLIAFGLAERARRNAGARSRPVPAPA